MPAPRILLAGALSLLAPVAPRPAATDAPAEHRPATAVAVTADGSRLMVFDTATGADVRELVSGRGDLAEPALASDGVTVYYSTLLGDSLSLERVPVAGGEVESMGRGFAPAPSPDGRLLAYGYTGDDLRPCLAGGIAVRDLETGDERRFPDSEAPPTADDCPAGGWVDRITWAPDSRHLAYTVAGDPEGRVWILDTDRDDDLGEAELLDADRAYASPAWLPDGRVAVAEVDGPDDERQLVVVDPDTGKRDVIVPGLRTAHHIDADGSGEQLLLTVRQGDGARLVMAHLDDEGERAELHKPYGRAVW